MLNDTHTIETDQYFRNENRWFWYLLQHFFISPGKGSTKFPMGIFLWQNGRVSTLFCFRLTRARLSYSWW